MRAAVVKGVQGGGLSAHWRDTEQVAAMLKATRPVKGRRVSLKGEGDAQVPKTATRVTIRNQFQAPRNILAGRTAETEWAMQIAKRRIEHDRDRAKHMEHADWRPLGPPKYVEYGPADDPCGEWASDFWLPHATKCVYCGLPTNKHGSKPCPMGY